MMRDLFVWLAIVYSFQGGRSIIAVCDSKGKAIRLCVDNELSASGKALEFDENNSAFGKDANNRYQVMAISLNTRLYNSDFGSY